MPGADWFPGATLNYAEHALRPGGTAATSTLVGDDSGEAIAVIEVTEDGTEQLLTLPQLRARVGAAEAGLRRLGVGVGDRVVALVPNSADALVGFLATAALGAVWSSCSPDFGAHAVIDRFTQIEPTVLIAVDGYRYGGREFAVGDTVQAIRQALPSLAGAVHIPALGTDPADGMISWAELTSVPAEPRVHPGAVLRATVGAVFLRHHRTAETDCPIRRRHSARAPEIPAAALGSRSRRSIPLVHHDRLDDVEFPHRWAAGGRDRGALRRQPRPS